MKFPAAFAKQSKNIHVIIETPKGSGNKYTFDPETGLYKLSKILPEGLVFPLHFGFIPHTKGEDGDPLDVLVFMDEQTYPGTLLECKVLGIIEAEQTERNGDTMRNDRIVAAAVESTRYSKFTSLSNLGKLTDELVKFFITYNEMSDKIFKPLGNKGPREAIRLIKKQIINE